MDKKKVKSGLVTVLIVLLCAAVIGEGAYIVYLKNQKPVVVEPESPWDRGLQSLQKWGSEWDPFDEMERLQQEINRMFRNAFQRTPFAQGSSGSSKSYQEIERTFQPDLDIKETKDAYKVMLDIPGMTKDSIQITVQDGVLSVAGERNVETKNESPDGRYYSMERSYGTFHRTIPLPGEIEEDAITATYENGVLTLSVPKPESDGSVPPQEKKVLIQ